jgi:hypothetical protein
VPEQLEAHLCKRLSQAKESCPDDRIRVVYGKKCYTSTDEPLKRVDSILQSHGRGIVRVQGDYGYDMLASSEDRQRISGGRENRILWFTLGWLKSWQTIYQKYFGWDGADANANFPGFYDRIFVWGLTLTPQRTHDLLAHVAHKDEIRWLVAPGNTVTVGYREGMMVPVR